MRGAAVRFLLPPSGTVANIQGLELAQTMTGVREIHVDVARGEIVEPLRDDGARVGHVITDAEHVTEAVRRAEAARDAVRIETRTEDVQVANER